MRISRVLLPHGSNPPQNNLPFLKGTDQMFLYAAWVHGMDETAMIYRRTLFHYIQTHIEEKTQQGLQRSLTLSKYFTYEGEEKAWYCLTPLGLEKMLQVFGPPIENLSRTWDFEFITNIANYQIILYSSCEGHEYVFKIDNVKYSASEIVRKLQRENLYPANAIENASLMLFDFILKRPFNWHIINFPSISGIEIADYIKEEDEELTFKEGREYYALHRKKERNSDLVKLAKSIWVANNPLLRCQVCNFSFKEQYGDLGEGYIEAHHIAPLSELKEEVEAKVEDLMMVCSNCHKMLHIKRPWQTYEQLTTKLSKRWGD
jgi:5-methylcytosine-specific restriction endonuclease McrA